MIKFISKFFKKKEVPIKYLTKAVLTETDTPEIMVITGNELGNGAIQPEAVKYLGSGINITEYISVDSGTQYLLLTKNLTFKPNDEVTL